MSNPWFFLVCFRGSFFFKKCISVLGSLVGRRTNHSASCANAASGMDGWMNGWVG